MAGSGAVWTATEGDIERIPGLVVVAVTLPVPKAAVVGGHWPLAMLSAVGANAGDKAGTPIAVTNPAAAARGVPNVARDRSG